MPRQAMKLKAEQTTAEIEEGYEDIRVKMPLTLDTWDLADALGAYGPARPVIVESADGDLFTGNVTDIDEADRTLLVELA
jgi:hypothetical protein